jgi:hypothetical protein
MNYRNPIYGLGIHLQVHAFLRDLEQGGEA